MSSPLAMAACNPQVDVGEPPPRQVNHLTGVVIASDGPEGSAGRAIILAQQGLPAELQGTVPTGL
jgi:hypothetical protein